MKQIKQDKFVRKTKWPRLCQDRPPKIKYKVHPEVTTVYKRKWHVPHFVLTYFNERICTSDNCDVMLKGL